MKFMKLAQCIMSKTDHFTGNLGGNMTKHVSKKEVYHFINFRKEFKVESDRFNHEISVGQPVKNSERTCNFQGEVFNWKSYFVDLFGNKVNWNRYRWHVDLAPGGLVFSPPEIPFMILTHSVTWMDTTGPTHGAHTHLQQVAVLEPS